MIQQQISVRYEGHVQCVGFRFSVVSMATELGLTGWIRNEPDGSVCGVIEGQEKKLLAFLQAIRHSRLNQYITREIITRNTGTAEFKDFSVRY